MPALTTYAALTDLEWGDMSAPANAQFWLTAGAEEIDSKIGNLYSTPVILGNSPAQRPSMLLLKRINAWLAMGRSILATSVGGENDQLHQLGLFYVKEATSALDAIVSGAIVLVGADSTVVKTDNQTGPMISNLDDESLVESFASVFGDPVKTTVARQRMIPCIRGNPYTW